MPPNPDVSRPSVSDVRRRLLERAGGSSDTAGVARRLEVSEEKVQGRARRGELLFYRDAGRRRYPNAQFSGGDVLPGLEEVLDAMHVRDPWMRIQLFLDDDVQGALNEGRVDDAVRAVDSYLAPEGGGE